MVMTAELDAGPIVARWPVPLTGRETTPELEAAPRRPRGGRRAARSSSAWAAGPIDDRAAGRARRDLRPPFTRADGWIDWRRPAVEIDRQVRALQPWPGAWTTIDGRRIHVRRARPVAGVDDVPIGASSAGETPSWRAGSAALALEIVQPEGRATMPADAWRRGLGRDHVLLGAGRPEEVAR